MPRLEVEALVLEAREYRESSLLVSLLTREMGRIGAMAKGARRPKSSLASALQPFALLRVGLSVRSSGGLATLISADTVRRPDFARPAPGAPPLARVAYAGLFAEALTHSHENDPHSEELFCLARDFFAGLEGAEAVGSFALQGLFALLAALGFGLDPAALAPPAAGGACYLDVLRGTLQPGADPRRSGLPDPASRNRFILSSEALEALSGIVGAAAGKSEPRVVSRRHGRPLARLAVRLLETHLETRLRSARFLEEMALQDDR